MIHFPLSFDIFTAQVFIHIIENHATEKSWEEYYKEETVPTQIEQFIINGSDSTRRVYDKGKVYVKNSLFEGLRQADCGGGICYNTQDTTSKLLVEDSQFVLCSAVYRGGGIYKYNEGHSVLVRVCGFDCTTTFQGISYDGTFANIDCTNVATPTYMNYVYEAQISHCTNENYGYTLTLHCGECIGEKLNISQNYCYQCPAFIFKPSTGQNSSLRYSSISNNTATYTIITQNESGDSHEIVSSNLIYNHVNSKEWGVLSVFYAKTTLRQDCIIGNISPNKIFSTDKKGSFNFINCTVSSDQFKNVGDLNINTGALTPGSDFINALKLLNTGNCYGTYDVIGSLTPDIPSPEQTPRATKNIYVETCKTTSKFKNNLYLTSLLYSHSS